MKRLHIIILLIAMVLCINAQPQGNNKFNPERFMREQEAFITKEAHLTQQEAAAFFPIFREMQNKQRELFGKMREYAHKNPQNDKEAASFISNMDNINMQIQKIAQQYHSRFCKAIPARKVLLCIKAQEMFKHKIMDNLAQRMKRGEGPDNRRQKRPQK